MGAPEVPGDAGRAAWQGMLRLFYGQAHARFRGLCAEVGLTPGALRALLQLRPGTGVPMRDISEEWRCDASYVTSLADELERHGLAERRAHPHDRRVRMLVLTQTGEATREAVLARLSEPPAAFHHLTAGEQAELRDLLAKLTGGDDDPRRRAPLVW